MRISQRIFKENYDIFNSLNPNINIRDNANKMINCGNGDGILYACEDCLTFKYVPFTCKSRFCLIVAKFILRIDLILFRKS